MSRVLVIKLGYRQELTSVVSRDVSLASVLQSTVILNLFRCDEVTWVTTPAALALVSGAPGVGRTLVYGHEVSRRLSCESFDVVVNLEPGWEFCALAESVNARLRFGFSLDASGYEVVPLPGAERALALERSSSARRKESRPCQQVLYEIMGKDWQGEPLVLGYRPAAREEFDIGLNMHSQMHWQNKTWPREHWRKLEELLFGRCSISYQQHQENLHGYIDWLSSCRVVVTADTLGLYLALALGRKVVGLFGPTSAERCHTYGRGMKLTPDLKLNCIPCCEGECGFERSCVETISPRRVAEAAEILLHADVLEK